MKREIIGGYTSFYRSQVEPCSVNADECDLRNMELLGFSKSDPLYLITKNKVLGKRNSRILSESELSALVSHITKSQIIDY